MKSISVNFFFLVLLFLGIAGFAKANERIRYYDITVAGFTIGELKTTRVEKGEITEYEVKSLVSIWFFGTLKIEFTINSIYKNGQFISSRTVSNSNRGEFLSLIEWDGQKYQVDANSYKFTNQESILTPIQFSTAKAFFEEPDGSELFLSENYGLTSPIAKSSDGMVEIQIDGNRNKYFYENGELVKANMQSPIKNYVLKLRR